MNSRNPWRAWMAGLLAAGVAGCSPDPAREAPAEPPAAPSPTNPPAAAIPGSSAVNPPAPPAAADPVPPAPTTVATPSVPPAPAPEAPAPPRELHPEVRRVVGRWVRPDGGYVLDLRSVSAEGRLDAAYLNPNPIKVSRAEARHDGTQARVFVELRDENYPGCTYTLAYSPATDQLYGVYFQALVQESYDVMFVREPAGR